MAETRERAILSFTTQEGSSPFEEWVSQLRDRCAKARIYTRIDRVRLGNFGDCRSVGGGVYELRIDYGPGYRVYFGLIGAAAVLLLCGGGKPTQRRDIERAHQCWKEFKTNANTAP